MGTVFALFVVFTAAQVWSDRDRASEAVDEEASALRAFDLSPRLSWGLMKKTIRRLMVREVVFRKRSGNYGRRSSRNIST